MENELPQKYTHGLYVYFKLFSRDDLGRVSKLEFGSTFQNKIKNKKPLSMPDEIFWLKLFSKSNEVLIK